MEAELGKSWEGLSGTVERQGRFLAETVYGLHSSACGLEKDDLGDWRSCGSH
jgi:hypothetical protein